MARYKLVPKPESKVKLDDYDPDYHDDFEEDEAVAEVNHLREKMENLQGKLYAEGKQSLLIVFQAMDTGGKDGAIKKVFEGINPQGVHVAAFKSPTPEEISHDFLWRVHPHAPPKGYIGIFNRSHYEQVLIVRVNELEPREVWKKHYDHINAFEQLLVDSGTRILKFYLHISKDEQKKRFQSRLENPEKNWKFETGDLAVREKWDDYMKAYQDIFKHCNTEVAPWYIVPANHKWYRDLIIIRTVVETLEDMNPKYPPPEAGLDKVVIPD